MRDVSGCIPDGNWQDTRQEGEVYFTGMDGEISFRLSTLKEKDFRDVSALCSKFGIELPAEYERFKERILKPS